ncbi:carotenoid biosynthesis protein [Mucilaginibacter conchicola]|nr:carotenoid biosynthesis protein [Mucilaginibacter conchicola]
MERQKDIIKPARAAIVIIILFHLVGLVGFCIPSLQSLFKQLVPYHLLLMLLVIIFSHKWVDAKFFIFIILIAVLGFTAEWLGVHKYWIFGDYSYGPTLGYKLLDIPLLIGVNWFLLIYSVGVLIQYSRLRNALIRILLGAAILVLLDVLIEPVAIRFDYWNWESAGIPLKNYGCWFGLSILLLSLFELFRFKKQNMAALVLLITQFVFFGVLNL